VRVGRDSISCKHQGVTGLQFFSKKLVEWAGRSFALGLYCTVHSVREIVVEPARVSRLPIALSLEAQANHIHFCKCSLLKTLPNSRKPQTTPPRPSWKSSSERAITPRTVSLFVLTGKQYNRASSIYYEILNIL